MLKNAAKLKILPLFRSLKRFRRFFLQVGVWRASLEFMLIFSLVSGGLLFFQGSSGTLSTPFIFSLLVSIGPAAARLRLNQTAGQKTFWLEGFALVRFILACYPVWTLFFLYALWYDPAKLYFPATPLRNYYSNTLLGLTIIVTLFFILFRGLLYLWSWLDLRQRHQLRWALTYAHFKLAVLIIVILYSFFVFSALGLNGSSGQTIGSQVVTDVSSSLYFVFSLLILLVLISTLILLVIAPVFIVFSYLTMQPTIRKLETLLTATRQLRQGNYSNRIPIAGTDELAQLQENFNQMAAQLEETMGQLQTERDTVQGLLQSNRELVVSVSHELRTPVAAIRGYVEALLNWSEAAPPPTLRHDLAVIERETLQLQTLIDDLFLLSRAEVGRLTLNIKNADPAPLIRRTVETAAPLAWRTRKVQVLSDLPDQLPPTRLDETRLEQILSNLIQNAIRHTPPGGLIVVTAQPQAATLGLEVRDTGGGIAATDLPYIWQRFYQANHNLSGTGLGLTIVKELTEALGGTVSVESQPGQGSSFKVNLLLAAVTKD